MTRNVKFCLILLLLLVLSMTVVAAVLAEPLDDPTEESSSNVEPTDSSEASSEDSSEASSAASSSTETSSEAPSNQCTVTVQGDHITVYFNGSSAPSTQYTTEIGSTVSFRVVPDTGYQVDSVTLFGTLVPASGDTYTITAEGSCIIRVVTSQAAGTSSDAPIPSQDPSSSEPEESSEEPVPTAELRVTIKGAGTVSSNGQTVSGTGDASQTGSIQLEVGVPTQVLLSPAYGYQVAELKLDGNARVPQESMTLRITELTTLEVTFAPDTVAPTTYQVVVSVAEGGYVTVSTGTETKTITNSSETINVNAGGSLIFGVYPAEGYELDALLVGGEPKNVSGGSFVLQSIAANTNVTIRFKETSSTITPAQATDFTWIRNANGLIELDLKNNSYIGKSVIDKINTLTAADGEYVVLMTQYVRWYIPCGGKIEGVTGEYYQLSVATGANGSYYSTIEASIHQSTPDAVFNYYELLTEPSFPDGTKVSFHMLELASTHVGNNVDLMVRSDRSLVSVDTGSVEADGWTTRMGFQNSRYLVVLVKTVDQYTITASAGEHGRIDPSGSNVVAAQASCSFTITADEGYVISAIYVDEQALVGVEDGTTYRYTIPSVTGNHTIRAEFKLFEGTDQPAGRSYAGLIVALIIAFVAVGGAAALFIVKWRQEKL